MCIDPVKAIARAKKEKNMAKTVGALIAVSFLISAASVLWIGKIFSFGTVALMFGISAFLIVFVAVIVFGYLIQLAATILGGKGKYFEGLTSMTYAMVPLSAGVFISALLSFLPYTGIINALILAVSATAGISILYRSIKDFFSTDMITAFVVVSVFMVSVLFTAYILAFMNFSPLLGGIMGRGMVGGIA